MKLVNIDHPVRASWLTDQASRLDPAPYLSGAYEARKLLDALPRTEPLADVTRKANGIFHAGRLARRWVTDPKYGVPFFSSTDILEADFSFLPLVARSSVEVNPKLLIDPGWTLITRSGRVGRVAYARPDVGGFACSEDVLRVVPERGRIAPGYLNTFLRSRFGVPVITGAAYGAIVQHIEPHHLADLPVPRFDETTERKIHDLVERAAQLRADFQADVVAATRDLFDSAGLPELADLKWYEKPRDVGFTVSGVSPTTLRALNFSPRAQELLGALRSVPHRTLGDICSGGMLDSGTRFKRIDSSPDHGVRLIGQRQGFWLRPEGRWIDARSAPFEIFAQDETVMIAAQGTLGENEVYGRALFVTGSWLKNAYTQHFLRAVSGDHTFPGAYLFAFLRSDVAFRILRSMSVGSKQQDIHPMLRRQIPVPECTPEDRVRISETVRRAYRYRDEADACEDEALRLLDVAVREAAG